MLAIIFAFLKPFVRFGFMSWWVLVNFGWFQMFFLIRLRSAVLNKWCVHVFSFISPHLRCQTLRPRLCRVSLSAPLTLSAISSSRWRARTRTSPSRGAAAAPLCFYEPAERGHRRERWRRTEWCSPTTTIRHGWGFSQVSGSLAENHSERPPVVHPCP